jgi:carbon-monoxide dehydrogenase medium subunit
MDRGKIATARVGLTGAGSHARRLPELEQAIAGHAPASGEVERAVQAAGQDLADLNADLHASAEYRRAMIPVFTRRALLAAAARA